MARSTLVRVDRPAVRRRRIVALLTAAAAGVWILDIGMVVAGAH